jgi:hypothetical protein
MLRASSFRFHEVAHVLPFDSSHLNFQGFGKDEIQRVDCLNDPPRLVVLDGVQDTQVGMRDSFPLFSSSRHL